MRKFLNISNHPSEKWDDEQRKAALEMTAFQKLEKNSLMYDLSEGRVYTKTLGEIIDIGFPQVPPDATPIQLLKIVDTLVDGYTAYGRYKDIAGAMVQGEFTLTSLIIEKLKSLGIPCYAATTNRIVEEKDGKKIVTFQFIQFRKYLTISEIEQIKIVEEKRRKEKEAAAKKPRYDEYGQFIGYEGEPDIFQE